eukprot:CAMPEP_0183736922 /NCGR_PEP_ID=MMETSP0737-20130205/50619_1 /TAXON_ID=385413 /ORGANISM="Thalassiosira miniscula, Strain CCMP1093" /LENGTH=107 /DNA_ID=CAMNT_0025971067 /DNA_START=214 /DNA_END=534 /DNA_ORIENTATION=+
MANVHCSYVVQQISWHSSKHSELVLANPSGPGLFSHLALQSDTERKNAGSFLVPLTSPLSFGFCPGTMGARPVFQMVSPSAASADCEVRMVDPVATAREDRIFFVHS